MTKLNDVLVSSWHHFQFQSDKNKLSELLIRKLIALPVRDLIEMSIRELTPSLNVQSDSVNYLTLTVYSYHFQLKNNDTDTSFNFIVDFYVFLY